MVRRSLVVQVDLDWVKIKIARLLLFLKLLGYNKRQIFLEAEDFLVEEIVEDNTFILRFTIRK